MDNPEKNGHVATAADLEKKWSQLKDVDRARAVHEIHQAGTSFRALAKNLNCSPTLLRHLDLAAQAPTLDQGLARQGKISTRELARRGRAAAECRSTNESEVLEHKRMQATQEISKAICDWLETEGLSGGHGEQIVDEARRLLASAETTKQLPAEAPPGQGTALPQNIERMRPKWAADNTILDTSWYAIWLVRWVYFALPDSLSRHQALGRALDNQIRG